MEESKRRFGVVGNIISPFNRNQYKTWLYYSDKCKNIIPKLLILFRKCGIIVKK